MCRLAKQILKRSKSNSVSEIGLSFFLKLRPVFWTTHGAHIPCSLSRICAQQSSIWTQKGERSLRNLRNVGFLPIGKVCSHCRLMNSQHTSLRFLSSHWFCMVSLGVNRANKVESEYSQRKRWPASSRHICPDVSSSLHVLFL